MTRSIPRSASESAFDAELRRLRAEHNAVRAEWELLKREYYARKFDPNQPRDD